MQDDFSGRHVVVTGGGGDLGSAVTRHLVDAGAICHLPVRRAIDVGAFGNHADRIHLATGIDATDESAIGAFYRDLPELWASIHCAGGFAASPVEATSLADLQRMLATNTVATFLCCREAARRLRASTKAEGGRIVNVAARPALEPRQGAGMVAYTASKAAVAGMTQALAEELAPDHIWVNAVAPAMMDTPTNRRAMPNADASRWPTLDEVATTIVFLASPQNRCARGGLLPVYGRS